MKNRKPPLKQGLLELMHAGKVELCPLRFGHIEATLSKPGSTLDLLAEARWGDQQVCFAIEYKSLSTPKAFDEAIRWAENAELPDGYRPLVIMPFLRDTQLAKLEERSVSGVDLCGNGIVIVPGKLLVRRSGQKNQFASYSPIKNVYRKNTSMVARALLAQPKYRSVQDLRNAVNTRNVLVARWGKTPMSLSTVSKALKSLEEDLIIDRSEGVRLLQADKLLMMLSESYEKPPVVNRVQRKVDCERQHLSHLVREKAFAIKTPVTATGLASVTRYAVMQRGDMLSIYCPRGLALLKELPGKEESRFPNLELLETEDQPVYFDARDEDGFVWASPVQTYLELAAGDKRDRETAGQVRGYLLNQLAGASR